MAPCITAEATRERLRAAMELIDAGLATLRDTPTDDVGNAFRVELAERLETQQRTALGLSYRMFGELFEPPDGPDPTMVEDVSLRDVLWARLRITPAEIRRRARVAARIRPRRSLTGPLLQPELPELAAAVEQGLVGEGHIREVCRALDVLPSSGQPGRS